MNKRKGGYVSSRFMQQKLESWGDEIRFGKRKDRTLSRIVRRKIKRETEEEIKSELVGNPD